MIVDPSQKLPYEQMKIILSSFGLSDENQPKEVIFKMVLTHLLKRWYESKTQ